jgi:hypothetical protein
LAFNDAGQCLPVCEFRDLYTSGDPAERTMVAHVVLADDPHFPVAAVGQLRDRFGINNPRTPTGGGDTSPVRVQLHSSVGAFGATVRGASLQPDLTLVLPFWNGVNPVRRRA